MAAESEPPATTNDVNISIVLRSRNDGWCLADTLAAIRSQTRSDFELIAVDNASSDGSAEILQQEADRFIHVPEGAYEPGPVLNGAVEATRAATVVLINSDATPQHSEWLERLVAPLAADGVAAAYSRQIARPDARATVAFDLSRGYPADVRDAIGTGDGEHFFSFVSAAFHRDRWEERHFWDAGYAEDYEWTYRLRQAGHRLAYAADSVVMHSHNYDLRAQWRKRYRHGWADAKIHGRRARLGGTVVDMAKDIVRDTLHCLPRLRLGSVLYSPVDRFVQRYSFYCGSRDGFGDS